MLQSHMQWQKKLRAALGDSDAATRALLSATMSKDLYGTVQILARLSPRQVDALHAPARALVQQLLDQTRMQICQEAGFAPMGDWLNQRVSAVSGKKGAKGGAGVKGSAGVKGV